VFLGGTLARAVGIGITFFVAAYRCRGGKCESAVPSVRATTAAGGSTLSALVQVMLFTWICTIPKATIQATFGGVPLAQNTIGDLPKEQFFANAAAFAVLICAPIGVTLTSLIGMPLARKLKALEDRDAEANPPKTLELVGPATPTTDGPVIALTPVSPSSDPHPVGDLPSPHTGNALGTEPETRHRVGTTEAKDLLG